MARALAENRRKQSLNSWLQRSILAKAGIEGENLCLNTSGVSSSAEYVQIKMTFANLNR